MKYGIPTDDGATVAKVFGRARKFAVCDEGGQPFKLFENEGAASEHGAGTGSAAFLAEKGVTVVIAPEVGPKATEALSVAGISIEIAKAGLGLDEAIAGLGTTKDTGRSVR